jgi:hypothetical protein
VNARTKRSKAQVVVAVVPATTVANPVIKLSSAPRNEFPVISLVNAITVVNEATRYVYFLFIQMNKG